MQDEAQSMGEHSEDGDNPEKVSFLELIKRTAAQAAQEEWARNEAAARQQITDYARQVGTGVVSGQGFPELVPNITATTAQGRELTVASAKNRSWRTFVQGFGIDLGFALLSVLALAFGDFNFLDGAAWATLGVLVLKTIIQTAISYVARLKITPNYDKPEVSNGP